MEPTAIGASSQLRPAQGTWGQLRGLFDEAWDRTRRRRRWLLAAAITAAVALVVGVVAATQHDGQNTGPGRRAVAAQPALLALPRAPGIGVACPAANSIACDRVGIQVAISLADAPVRLVATVGGRSVELHKSWQLVVGRNHRTSPCTTGRSCEIYYTGYLQPAGLLDGALKVQPDKGRYRWYGRHPVTRTLRLRASYHGGRVAETTRQVPLAAGWG